MVAPDILLAALPADIHLRLGHPAQIGRAPHDQPPGGKGGLDHGLCGCLDLVERERRQEIAVRQLRQAIVVAADPGEGLHVVVPGLEVLIADRPVHAVTVLQVGLEVVRRPAVGLPRPGQRAPAQVIPADPAIGLARGRLVGVVVIAGPEGLVRVEEGVADPLVVRVVQGPLLGGHLVVTPGNAAGEVVAVARAMFHVRAALEHQDLQSALAELLGDPAAAHARPHDDGVEPQGRRHERSPPALLTRLIAWPSAAAGSPRGMNSWPTQWL